MKINNKKCTIRDRIYKLRQELETDYEKYGHVDSVVDKSQKLDRYIYIEQKNIISSKNDESD
ncbi:Spo0E family sporulation regulatory protein-aspartic acid phosphatase [Clostridiaceae bacterium M8S5]|nr:Spo0E family sporulation regulatory protein-aspartic acid phosphatase [Clostridiaceae bacterium M8S5]